VEAVSGLGKDLRAAGGMVKYVVTGFIMGEREGGGDVFINNLFS
jgi:hypothetical protein